MKYLFIPVILLAIFSCQDDTPGKMPEATPANQLALFDEQNYNVGKAIKSFGGNLYVFGQHFSKEDDGAGYNSTLVIMDTSFKIVAEKNYGGTTNNEKTDYNSFEMDEQGNVYFAGSKGGKPVVLKCNAAGELTWQKEYGIVNISSFDKILRDGGFFYLVGTGDSTVNLALKDTRVTKMDTSGQVLWTVAAGAYSPLFGLHIVDGKLILLAPSLNFSIDNSLHTRIVCYNPDGTYQWQKTFSSNDSKIRLGTKYMNSKLSKDQHEVLFMYNSSNQFIPDFGLAGIDTAGTIKILSTKKAGDIPVCDNDSTIFICYDWYSSIPGRAYAKMVVTDEIDFCQVYDADYDLVDYTVINGTKYFIGNRQNQEKHYSYWIVLK